MVSVLLLLMLPDRGSLTFMPRRFGDFIEAIGCGCRCRFVKVISRQASVYKNDTKKEHMWQLSAKVVLCWQLLTWVPTLGRPLTLTYFKRKRIWQSHSSWNSSPLSTWTDICHIAFISAPPNVRLFIFSSTKYDSVICRIDERKESMRWSWMRLSSKDLNCIIKIGALNSVTKDLFLTYFTNLHWF